MVNERKEPKVDDSYSDYAPCATPECRAPHVWLGSPGTAASTLDLVGTGFTVLAAEGGADWRAATAAAHDELAIDVDCYVIGNAALQDRGGFADAYGVAPDRAVLGAGPSAASVARAWARMAGRRLCASAGR